MGTKGLRLSWSYLLVAGNRVCILRCKRRLAPHRCNAFQWLTRRNPTARTLELKLNRLNNKKEYDFFFSQIHVVSKSWHLAQSQISIFSTTKTFFLTIIMIYSDRARRAEPNLSSNGALQVIPKVSKIDFFGVKLQSNWGFTQTLSGVLEKGPTCLNKPTSGFMSYFRFSTPFVIHPYRSYQSEPIIAQIEAY